MARESMAAPVALLGLAAGINLFNIGLILGKSIGENNANAPDRIHDVKTHNAQIYKELEPTYQGLGHLVLNDETDTFEFHVSPEGEKPQTCSGEYKVVDNTAKLTGNIACTTTVKAGGN